jgi:2',3'-cyclic-nucleotide 2'-phosphodiesterase (5'-nucleotidase family)
LKEKYMPPISQKVRILHTNDIHGRIEGLARIATLVKRERQTNPDLPILYLDGGDVEESSVRLSSMTRGVGMHRLLTAAGCDAATIGNGGLQRYSYQVLKEYGAASNFPQLLANYRLPDGSFPEGVHASTILHAGALHLGVIGISANVENSYTSFFGMQELPASPLVRELALQLRQQGADVVILLSHMGLETDRKLAADLQDLIPLIIGAHSHSLLPEGERVGDVLLAQAGDYAQHLGFIDLLWDGSQLHIEQVRVLPVSEEVPQEAAIQEEIARIDGETVQFLSEVIGEFAEPLDFSIEHECGAVNLMAEIF